MSKPLLTQSQLLSLYFQAKREHWTSLDLSMNRLGELPDWLGKLSDLQSLDISHNELVELPDSLGQLSGLQTLNIRGNNLGKLPEWLGQLSGLQTLNVGGNELSELPEWLGQLSQLQSLDIGFNDLGELPESLGQLSGLQTLYVSGNELGELPEWLGQLSQLQSLDISYNDLGELPEWLGQLSGLQTLNVRGNRLGELPEWLGQLSQLQSLDIGYNDLGELPEWLGQLSGLQTLSVVGNRLGELPEWLGQLSGLQTLNVRENKLGELPEFVVALPRLQNLTLYNNPIVEPSPELLGRALTSRFTRADIQAIRRYYEQLREAGEAAFYEAKLLIIGEGGAGKTSLAQKLQEPHADLQPDEKSTEGVDIITWFFDLPPDSPEEQYQVNIWDFGGQAVYFATHQLFLTRRSVYVLIADTRRQHTDFYTWLRMQETFGGDSPVLLLKNRNRDQGNRFTIENLSHLRERFPNLKGVIELDLSEVPRAETWPDLLRQLQHHFMGLEHVGKPRPRTWVNVRRALQEDGRDFVSKQEYLAICRGLGIKREQDALQLSDYLHNLGDILHFQEDPLLVDLVILNPTWGLDAVYRVLDNAAILEKWGRFTLKEVRALWHEAHYDAHHTELLRLMGNFQLCYRLSGEEDSFIAPQLLGDEAPPYEWDGAENVQLRYRYPLFMPRGLLSRAIVKLHQRIEDRRLVWRTGVVLRDDYARAELLEMPGEKEIRIRIAGQNKRDLLMEIVRALEDLHRGFPKLRYEKLIPCNCSTCITLKEPHFYDLEELRQRLAYKKETIECKKPPFETVSIRGLFDDMPPLTQSGQFAGANLHFDGHLVAGDSFEVDKIEGSSGVVLGRKGTASITGEVP